jgi:NADH/F420H2 dehydrogenase subunit C
VEQVEISRRIQERFGERLRSCGEFCGQHFVVVDPGNLVEILSFLRDESDLGMDMLIDVGGVDYLTHPEERAWRYEVAYQLYSLEHNHRFRVKVAVTDDTVSLPSLWEMWGVANWMEREVYDLFGLRFEGHPNLRRILCHDDFQGHALRKDYPINRRQRLERPVENLLTDDPSWA